MRQDDELLRLLATAAGEMQRTDAALEGVEPDYGQDRNLYGQYDRAKDRLRFHLRDFVLAAVEVRTRVPAPEASP